MADDRHQLPNVSSESVIEQFTKKMHSLELDARERETEQRARTLGVPYFNISGLAIPPETLLLIPRARAEELHVIAFLHVGSDIRVGALAPNDPSILELAHQLAERHQARVERYAVSDASLAHATKLYDAVPDVHPVATTLSIAGADLQRLESELQNIAALPEQLARVSISDLVTLILAGAIRAASSDIHIEAEEEGVALRYRIDGVLQRVAVIPKDRWKQLVSRVKLLARLKLNVADVPQDGRITIALPDDTVEVRVSTLPTTWGESIVMRLLMSSKAGLVFADLGVRGRAFDALQHEIARPNGMIVTTGPTGSGKTTTMYAILQQLNTSETKIVTLEDPVEYKLKGINQSQIDPAREYTFARGLRSILRQDPDIVMVGEIRDLETAEVAIHAALTGHLMLSTIHTNSAAGAIPRFLAMGVKAFLLVNALNAIIGQRLVRKIHDACRAPHELSPEERDRVEQVILAMPERERAEAQGKELHFSRGAGCDVCTGSGYKGRVGLYEILTMTPEIEQAIRSENVSEREMEALANRAGMITMVQDGILKALDGITSLDEVFRVAE
ncbi:MAG: GspE/PulE family protein [bacterium]|nr:GspE/PulE family protein [bacterium]